MGMQREIKNTRGSQVVSKQYRIEGTWTSRRRKKRGEDSAIYPRFESPPELDPSSSLRALGLFRTSAITVLYSLSPVFSPNFHRRWRSGDKARARQGTNTQCRPASPAKTRRSNNPNRQAFQACKRNRQASPANDRLSNNLSRPDFQDCSPSRPASPAWPEATRNSSDRLRRRSRLSPRADFSALSSSSRPRADSCRRRRLALCPSRLGFLVLEAWAVEGCSLWFPRSQASSTRGCR